MNKIIRLNKNTNQFNQEKKNQNLFLGSHRIVITLKINSVSLHKLVFSFVIIKIN